MLKQYLIVNEIRQADKHFAVLEKKLKDNPYFMNVGKIFSRNNTAHPHRIYHFPNGQGASVIKAFYTMEKWELAELQFKSDRPTRKMPKRKRLKKKWCKKYLNYTSNYDIIRFETDEELNEQLLEIKNRSL